MSLLGYPKTVLCPICQSGELSVAELIEAVGRFNKLHGTSIEIYNKIIDIFFTDEKDYLSTPVVHKSRGCRIEFIIHADGRLSVQSRTNRIEIHSDGQIDLGLEPLVIML